MVSIFFNLLSFLCSGREIRLLNNTFPLQSGLILGESLSKIPDFRGFQENFARQNRNRRIALTRIQEFFFFMSDKLSSPEMGTNQNTGPSCPKVG